MSKLDQFSEKMAAVGGAINNITFISVIKNSFSTFMPFTIIGAMGTLWTAVICNAKNGLGAIWEPIMKLSFLNPAFSALNFCTLGCIALGIAFIVGTEVAKKSDKRAIVCGILGVACTFMVSNIYYALDESTLTCFYEQVLSAKNLFTAILVSYFSVTMFVKLSDVEQLKIKMPPQVPANISKSFEELIPIAITLITWTVGGLIVKLTTGFYVNELISALIQKPLMNVGGSLPGALFVELLILVFWSMGIHGENMVSGVWNPIVTALLLENTAAVEAGVAPTNIINWAFMRIFTATGGTGFAIAITIAIFLVGKREENKAISKITIVPNLFNINEVVMFGLPVVLNPIMMIPFILVPIVNILFGYFMTVIGICPVFYLQLPWTMPPFLMGFLCSGGNIMGGLVQLAAIAIAVVIYIPFIIAYEKQVEKAN